MAERDHITACLMQEDFKVNGCGTLIHNEATHYFSCAHAVLATFAAHGDAGEEGVTNAVIRRNTLAAVETLIELGMWQLRHERIAA